jgi:hypothetical protein
MAYARIAALRCLRNLRGRGAMACALVVPAAVAGIVHAPPPFGKSGEPEAVRLAAGMTAGLTCCLGVGLLAAFLVGDEWERGRARALRAAGLDVPAMIAAQSIFVAGAAALLSILAVLGPCVLSLRSISMGSWRFVIAGVFAAALVTGLFGLGLPLVVPRWAALTAITLIAVVASGSGAGLDETTHREAALEWTAWFAAAAVVLVLGALRAARRLDQGSA